MAAEHLIKLIDIMDKFFTENLGEKNAEIECARNELEEIVSELEERRKNLITTMDRLIRAEAELAEWENAKRFVADGRKDELHCGCVPILKRELDEQKQFTKLLIARIQLLSKPIDVTDFIDDHRKHIATELRLSANGETSLNSEK
jgi:hypothetical protein